MLFSEFNHFAAYLRVYSTFVFFFKFCGSVQNGGRCWLLILPFCWMAECWYRKRSLYIFMRLCFRWMLIGVYRMYCTMYVHGGHITRLNLQFKTADAGVFVYFRRQTISSVYIFIFWLIIIFQMADKKDGAEPEGEEEFSVEKVLDRRMRNGKVRFFFQGHEANKTYLAAKVKILWDN